MQCGGSSYIAMQLSTAILQQLPFLSLHLTIFSCTSSDLLYTVLFLSQNVTEISHPHGCVGQISNSTGKDS